VARQRLARSAGDADGHMAKKAGRAGDFHHEMVGNGGLNREKWGFNRFNQQIHDGFSARQNSDFTGISCVFMECIANKTWIAV
jgi:hypothetical protein